MKACLSHLCFTRIDLHILQVRSDEDREDDGHCIWYGQVYNNLSDTTLNTVYNGPAKPLTNKDGLAILREFCSSLIVNGKNAFCFSLLYMYLCITCLCLTLKHSYACTTIGLSYYYYYYYYSLIYNALTTKRRHVYGLYLLAYIYIYTIVVHETLTHCASSHATSCRLQLQIHVLCGVSCRHCTYVL